jgi:hypothetical protein
MKWLMWEMKLGGELLGPKTQKSPDADRLCLRLWVDR